MGRNRKIIKQGDCLMKTILKMIPKKVLYAFIIEILKNIAKKTTNDIDDKIVNIVDTALKNDL